MSRRSLTRPWLFSHLTCLSFLSHKRAETRRRNGFTDATSTTSSRGDVTRSPSLFFPRSLRACGFTSLAFGRRAVARFIPTTRTAYIRTATYTTKDDSRPPPPFRHRRPRCAARLDSSLPLSLSPSRSHQRFSRPLAKLLSTSPFSLRLSPLSSLPPANSHASVPSTKHGFFPPPHPRFPFLFLFERSALCNCTSCTSSVCLSLFALKEKR